MDDSWEGEYWCREEASHQMKRKARSELANLFSSRRRHTRCLSDWSSDVCSSDLHHHRQIHHDAAEALRQDEGNLRLSTGRRGQAGGHGLAIDGHLDRKRTRLN